MAWRLAKSLETLRNQVNSAYPNRSKISDGTVGDAAHAKTPSDHNPNASGVVCALDLTHHAGYFDAHALAEVLIRNRHPNLKYVISNSRIASAATGWNWVKYSGSNPHSKHIHVSVGNGSDGKSTGNYDSQTNWNIGGSMAKAGKAGARILGECILGRDRDAVHAGKYPDIEDGHAHNELSEGYLMGLWNSAEGVAYAKVKKTHRDFYNKYSKQIAELESRPTKAQLDKLTADMAKEAAKVQAAEEKLASELAKRTEDTQLLNEAGSWLQKLFNRLFKKG